MGEQSAYHIRERELANLPIYELGGAVYEGNKVMTDDEFEAIRQGSVNLHLASQGYPPMYNVESRTTTSDASLSICALCNPCAGAVTICAACAEKNKVQLGAYEAKVGQSAPSDPIVARFARAGQAAQSAGAIPSDGSYGLIFQLALQAIDNEESRRQRIATYHTDYDAGRMIPVPADCDLVSFQEGYNAGKSGKDVEWAEQRTRDAIIEIVNAHDCLSACKKALIQKIMERE